MDVKTIKEKQSNLKYRSAKELEDDILLMFDNAIEYNGPRHPVGIEAQKLKDFYQVPGDGEGVKREGIRGEAGWGGCIFWSRPRVPLPHPRNPLSQAKKEDMEAQEAEKKRPSKRRGRSTRSGR